MDSLIFGPSVDEFGNRTRFVVPGKFDRVVAVHAIAVARFLRGPRTCAPDLISKPLLFG